MIRMISRSFRVTTTVAIVVPVACSLLLVGCGSAQEGDASDASLARHAGFDPMKSVEDSEGVGADIYGGAATDSESQERDEVPSRDSGRFASSGDVDQASSTTRPTTTTPEITATEITPVAPVEADTTDEPSAPVETREARIRRVSGELVELLRAEAFESRDPARQYMAMTGLEMIRPGILATLDDPDHEARYDLSPPELASVTAFRDLLNEIARDARRDPSTLADHLSDAADQMADDLPVRIRRVELCRAVHGYGNVEPFAHHRFRGGRANQVIVYTEVDRLSHQRTSEGNQIELEVGIGLHHDADSTLVRLWDREKIVETSTNRRDEFYLVTTLTLPEQLSLGRYNLKVRVRDLVDGSVDERSALLEIVAD